MSYQPIAHNFGCMNTVMRTYEDVMEEDEVPYVTMREVNIEDIQD